MGSRSARSAFLRVPVEPLINEAEDSSGGTRPNIILIQLDDFGWSDLPFDNAPIVWPGEKSVDGILRSSPQEVGALGQGDGGDYNDRKSREAFFDTAKLKRPALNRLAARIFACADEGEEVCEAGQVIDAPYDRALGVYEFHDQKNRLVVPVDEASVGQSSDEDDTATHTYASNRASCAEDDPLLNEAPAMLQDACNNWCVETGACDACKECHSNGEAFFDGRCATACGSCMRCSTEAWRSFCTSSQRQAEDSAFCEIAACRDPLCDPAGKHTSAWEIPLDAPHESHCPGEAAAQAAAGICVDEERMKTYCGQCMPATDMLRDAGGLRRLARDGVRLEHFYATSSRCMPTRSSTLSGLYIPRDGIPSNNGTGIVASHVTIAEQLKQLTCDPVDESSPEDDPDCYEAIVFGKWHLGGGPGQRPWIKSEACGGRSHAEQGFDQFVGFGGGSRKYFSMSDFKCSNNNADQDFPTLYLGLDPSRNGFTCEESGTSGEVDDPIHCCSPKSGGKHAYSYKSYNERWREFDFRSNRSWQLRPPWGSDGQKRIKTKPRSANEEEHAVISMPRLRLWPCNDDLIPPSESGCTYSTRVFGEQVTNYIYRHQDNKRPFFMLVPLHATHFAHQAPSRTKRHYEEDTTLTNQDGTLIERVQHPNASYWAIIEEVDAFVGRLLDSLGSTQLRNNTVVILMADQGRAGGHYGDPILRGGKTNVYEGGIRVPLIMWGPGIGTPDEQWEVLRGNNGPIFASQVDLFPTLGELALRMVVDDCEARNGDCWLPVPDDTPLPFGEAVECDNTTHEIDGRSFASMTADGDGSDNLGAFVFASYGQQDAVVTSATCATQITRESEEVPIRMGICAHDDAESSKFDEVVGEVREISLGDGGLKWSHRVRGASKTICTEDSGCTSNADCQVLGRVCVTRADADGGTISDESWLTPCRGNRDCPNDQICESEVPIPCNVCKRPRWKLINRTLFDLTTNPVEDQSLALSNTAACESDPNSGDTARCGAAEDLTPDEKDFCKVACPLDDVLAAYKDSADLPDLSGLPFVCSE